MNELLLSRSKGGLSLLARRLVFILAALGLAVALVYAHIDIKRMGDDYKGAILLVDRIFDLSFAFGLTAAAFCVGRRAARLLSLEYANIAEELSFSIMIGVGIIGIVTLGLGLAGCWRRFRLLCRSVS